MWPLSLASLLSLLILLTTPNFINKLDWCVLLALLTFRFGTP